jgi:UDP-N-acetylmuramoyl-tripeptide--D-alanyl-D-alanine ligase
VIDSREAGPGVVFLALPGSRAHGADFAADAVRRGSPFVMADRPLAVPHALVSDPFAALRQVAEVALRRVRVAGQNPMVIANTGSLGKTTTKDLLARILSQVGETVASPGSFNNHIGVPLTVTMAGPTTQFLVLEMGANHEGEIAALTRLAPPDVAVVLSVSNAHVGEFGSIEAIARAKAELVESLGPTGVAVLNLDDPLVAGMAFLAAADALTFGFDSAARIMGHDMATDAAGRLRLGVTDQDEDATAWMETELIGEQLAGDVLGAVAAAVAVGVPVGRAAAALDGVGPISPHRMAVSELDRGITLIDDAYNASPESVAAALEFAGSLARRSGRQAEAVLGSMLELGDESAAEHRRIGALVAREGFSRLIVVGSHARPMCDAAVAAGMPASHVEHHPAERAPDGLAAQLAQILGPGVVLIKGSNSVGLWRLADQLKEQLRAPDARSRPPGGDARC